MPLNILIVEDSEADAELTAWQLKRAGMQCTLVRVEQESAFIKQITESTPDLIISDYTLPGFDGLAALEIAHRLVPHIPFIFISGTIGEDTAVEMLRRGATDYLIKNNLIRLPDAVKRALLHASERANRARMEDELRQSEQRFRLFMNHLPGAAFIKNQKRQYIFANTGFEQVVGRNVDQILGKTDVGLFSLEDAARNLESDTQVLRDGQPVRELRKLEMEIGQKTWLTTKFRLPVNNGQDGYVGGIALDISEQTETLAALRRSEERFKLIAEATNDAIWDWDMLQDVTTRNHAYRQHFGFDPNTLESGFTFWEKHVHPDDRQRVIDSLIDTIRNHDESWSAEYRMLDQHGNCAEVLDRCRFIYNEQQAIRAVGATMDLTRHKKTEAALRLSERAIEASIHPIIVVDHTARDAPITYVNPAFQKITGYSPQEAIGKNCRFLQGADQDQAELEKIRAAVREEREGHALLRNYRKDGSLFWNDLHIAPVKDATTGKVTHYVSVIYDLTELKRYQDELENKANYDGLTGIANRSLLADRLKQSLAICRREKTKLSVAFIDLDNFKRINDSLGHGAGDSLLKIVALRLRECIREGDTLARVGGDEFVLILPERNNEDEHGVMGVISRIRHLMNEPVSIQEREFRTTCSIGVAVYPRDGEDGEILLRNADAAMYRAKELGRNTFQFYSHEMNADIMDRLSLEACLWDVLKHDQLHLQFQPQICLKTNQIIGAEALIRWHHPALGIIPPDRFIPLAEENGMIISIGRWVIEKACEQNQAWQAAGLPPIRIAINLSLRQFRQHDLSHMIADVLTQSGMDPRLLELEITESAAMHDVDQVLNVMNELKAMGAHICIDDFGTGYSSLAHLKRFPVARFKIDKSFISDINTNPADLAIVQTIISLGHGLGHKLVAEGVETEAQLQRLCELGCDEAQGYFISRPVDGQAINKLLVEKRSNVP